MKAEDVVSALKNITKSNRKKLQKGDPKNVTSPGGAQERGKGVQQTQKARGKARANARTSRRAKDKVHPRTKARRKDLARERRNHPRVKALEKERKEEKLEARPGEIRKVKNLRPVIQLFSNLMEGATMQDWLSLFDFQNTRRRIYYYNHETRCVDQPCRDSAPWPVLWILARFHPRHIWCVKSLPNVVNCKASLNIFANRIRWRWFFRDKPKQQFSICVPPHGRTRVCTHLVAPSLDTWISSLKRCLTELFIKSSRTASRDRSFCNKILLVNFGLEILSKSGLEAVANDKDGGYSLVDPNVLTNVHLQLLMNGQYFETDIMNRDRRCAKASLSYSILCKRVEDLEQEPELARVLKKSLSTPGASIEVQLVTSCKSHKPPGAVKFRNIHSAPRHAFAGLAMWSASQHREHLKQFPTLYRDTATSSRTFHPSKLCLGIILCVWTLRKSS